ncbi:MAG: hypothetical protein ABIR71_14605 [Chthoniobacterales bacterium]
MPPLLAIFRRQPPWSIMLGALALLGLIGWADYATGWEWSFFVLYAFPTVLVVWKTANTFHRREKGREGTRLSPGSVRSVR